MVTRKLVTPSTALVVGLVAGLAAHQAAASEELVVYGSKSSAVVVRLDQESIRADIANYVDSVNRQLRATLTQDVKGLPQPTIVLAGDDTQTRG